jgi:hypothetical protein
MYAKLYEQVFDSRCRRTDTSVPTKPAAQILRSLCSAFKPLLCALNAVNATKCYQNVGFETLEEKDVQSFAQISASSCRKL